MAAPYLYHDPQHMPPMKHVLIAFAVIIILGAIIVKFTDNHQFRRDTSDVASATPKDTRSHGNHGYPRALLLQGNDAEVEAPSTSAEIKEVMETARRAPHRSSMDVASPARVQELSEGFSFTGMHWCTATDYGTLRSVLQVSFTTEGAFGFALGTTDGPVPKAYSMPTESMGNVSIVGFDNPDLRRLYVALSGSPEVNNGWKVLGFVDLPAPLAVDWCGYSGVFQLTHPDGHVEGRAYVSVNDPAEDLLH